MILALVIAINIAQSMLNFAVIATAITAILAACVALNKTFLGKAVKWCWRRLFTQPLTEKFDQRISNAVTLAVSPQLEALRVDAARLEEKNDAQHGENKHSILEMGMRVEAIKYLIEEQNTQHNRHVTDILTSLTSIQTIYAQHVVEAGRRDERLDRLELKEGNDESFLD